MENDVQQSSGETDSVSRNVFLEKCGENGRTGRNSKVALMEWWWKKQQHIMALNSFPSLPAGRSETPVQPDQESVEQPPLGNAEKVFFPSFIYC